MIFKTNYSPVIELDSHYWQDNCFCPACRKFIFYHLEEGEIDKCPACGKVEMMSVETAIEIGILEGEI